MGFLTVDAATDFDCGFCENARPFGRSGDCNFSTSPPECLCPNGFSGQDDWLAYSGCQVRQSVRMNFHILLTILSAAGIVVSIICFFILVRKWRFKIIPNLFSDIITFRTKNRNRMKQSLEELEIPSVSPKKEVQNSSHSSLYSPPEFTRYRVEYAIALRNWKRRICILYSILLYLIYFVGGLLYNVPFLLNPDQDKSENKIIAVGYYLILASSFISALLLIMIWKYSLPNISHYGALLKMNKFLVQYPNFITSSFLLSGIVVELVYLIFCLIIPLTIRDKEILHYANLVTVIALEYTIALCLSTFTLLILTVEKVFHLAINTYLTRAANDNQLFDALRVKEIEFMKSAVKPISLAKKNNILVMSFNLCLEAFNLLTGTSQTYLYINLNFTIFCFMMITMPISFVLMEDRLRPQAIKTNQESVTTVPVQNPKGSMEPLEI